jgi:hypothetical protein
MGEESFRPVESSFCCWRGFVRPGRPVSGQLTAETGAREKGESSGKIKSMKTASRATRGLRLMKGTKRSSGRDHRLTGNYLDIYPRLEKSPCCRSRATACTTVEFNMDATLTTMVYTTESTSARRDKMTWKLVENRPHKYMTKNPTAGGCSKRSSPASSSAEYRVIVGLDLGVSPAWPRKWSWPMSKDDLPDVVECTANAWSRRRLKRPRK